MANKTRTSQLSPQHYIEAIEDVGRRSDCQTLLTMMEDVSGAPPKMWGDSMVGFDQYHYKYETGREGDFFRLGFSNRARNLTIYIMPGYQDFSAELARLGPHKKGKSCLYIKRLSDIDMNVLREICKKGLDLMAEKYPPVSQT